MAIQFSDITNKDGIIQHIEFNCGMGDGAISGNATLLKQITGQVNLAMSEVWHLVWSNQTGWQYDDSNHTDLPQAKADLSDGVATYAMPTDALTINRIEILDSQGNYRKITPIRERNIGDGIDEFFETSGMPQYYRLLGRTIELFPAPDTSTQATATNGLKVYFDRSGVEFDSADTTETPGFSAEYHDLIPTKVSIKWLQVNKPDSPTLVLLKELEVRREAQLVEFEANKYKDRRPLVMRGRSNNSR